MARFQFVGPSYTSQSVTADAQMSMNWYVEQIESQQGSSLFSLYPTPGLSIFTSISSPIRGMLTINGRCFAAAGSALYEVFFNGTHNALFSIANDNKPVSMAAAQPIFGSGTPQLAIVSAGTLYVMNLQTLAFSTPTGPVGTPFQIVYADGFYVLLNTNGVFQFSASLDATTWNGVESEAVSVYGDQTLAIGAVHRELWLFSAQKGVTYYDAGDSPIPDDVVTGGDMEQGIAAPWSLVALDNTMFWLGANKDGAGIAWRASGYTPQRISNHAVEFAWQSYSTITDAIAYGYQDQGHTFYVLYFPTANATWVYDVATGMWHQRGFWNTAMGVFTAHRSAYHVYCFGQHLVGDWASGNIYQMSISQTQDFGNVIRRVRRSPHISNEDQWMFYNQFQVDAETGLMPSQNLPSIAAPSFYTLFEGTNYWNVMITDLGALTTTSAVGTYSDTLFLNDSSGESWQITVDNLGIIHTAPAPYDWAGYNSSLLMYSNTGQTQWIVTITTLGILQTQLVGSVYRNPQMMMRWSDDHAHTWSQIYTADSGAPGNYKARLLWRRLGRARDRVFEISTTDPIPWRIIDGYILATPGYTPTERITDKIRKAS